jgi:uncharacterized protein (TIGR02246 family)
MFERVQAVEIVQLYDLLNDYAAACNSGDFERWLDLWSDDAIQLPPCSEPRLGKGDIGLWMKSRFEETSIKEMDIRLEQVCILGDKAYAYGTFSFIRTLRGGNEPTRVSGNFLDILTQQTDGSWKIAIDCHNWVQTLEEIRELPDSICSTKTK